MTPFREEIADFSEPGGAAPLRAGQPGGDRV